MKDYKKILEGVVDIINNTEKSDIGFANICTYIGENCPELKESEDEKIRKGLIENFKWFCGDYPETAKWGKDDNLLVKDIIAWLEKQGGHANFRNKIQIGDKVTRNEDGVLVNLSQLNRIAKKQGEQKPADTEKEAKGNKSEIPNYDWSGEDEDNMMMIEDRLSDYLDYIREDTSLTKHQKNSMKEEVIGYDNWFKSLRERYIWKPSDEQMAVLNEVINYAANSELQHWNNFIYTLLKSLREQLKKLREE